MTGNKIEELLMQMLQKVSSIDAILTTSQSILRDHEKRIDILERHPSNQINYNNDDKDYKSALLMLLSKSLLIALITLGTLAGAGGIISNIFSNSSTNITQDVTK